MLVGSGVGSEEDIRRATEESEGLGLFVRSLIGLDREAAKAAIPSFQEGKTLTANQIEFLNMIIDHLTERGYMPAELLYDSPFTDLSPTGVEGIFTSGQADELIGALETVRRRAVA
jgi:type I restriction enzyme R subunit